ncbi:EcsC family protein [Clostridium estertheticum]|uniref:EcsC family protein n=1 Tax=Clostridium estertheticum TaxID=238834 RepID=A0AA47I6N6_9CLOT|nr:EcsC family protein [Clostridium estertheticum]MBU3155595.1 EcsC family protein [Clostridium estertheticum]WAG60010.1 EcsC family protein [Clostridium estertheticum]
MNNYEENSLKEMFLWQEKMKKEPSFSSDFAKDIQNKMNNLLPDKIQDIINTSIENMTKLVLTGSEYTAKPPLTNTSLEDREILAKSSIDFYRKAATVSGAGTGASGLLIGLADFPILLSLKMKFLYEIASIYGFDVRDYKERLYILYVFQLAFSSDKRRIEIYTQISNWDNHVKNLPEDVNFFDWKTFQQEYRDYIDLAKMLQLVPGIGLVVGAYANYKLMNKLYDTAINAYRLRIFKK